MDPYAVLGLSRSCTREEIKSVYRRLALQLHPDRNPGNAEAERRFKECANAYEILIDPDKRQRFDTGRSRRPPPPPPPPRRKPPETKPAPHSQDIFDGAYRIVFDPTPEQLEDIPYLCAENGDILTHIICSREELAAGFHRTLAFKRHAACDRCAFRVAHDSRCPHECLKRHRDRPCQACRLLLDKLRSCPQCQGSGMGNWILAYIKIDVPPNTPAGTILHLHGEGEPRIGGHPGQMRIVLTMSQ